MTHDLLVNRLGALGLALHDRQARAVAVGTGLSESRAAALVSVGADPGIGVGRLSEVLGVTQSVATRIVDDLAGEGLLAKGPGRTGREVALTLTPEGAATRARILALRAGVLHEALGDVPAGAGPLLTLVDALLTSLTRSPREGDRICRLCDEEACGLDDCPVERAARRMRP